MSIYIYISIDIYICVCVCVCVCVYAVSVYAVGAQKACTGSVGLPSPHKQPKDTCPRLIWPLLS